MCERISGQKCEREVHVGPYCTLCGAVLQGRVQEGRVGACRSTVYLTMASATERILSMAPSMIRYLR